MARRRRACCSQSRRLPSSRSSAATRSHAATSAGVRLIHWNKGRARKSAYYCSIRIHRGASTCTNTAGVPTDGLDFAIKVKLADLLNRDFDRVLDLCEEQAQVWREKPPCRRISGHSWNGRRSGSKGPSPSGSDRGRTGGRHQAEGAPRAVGHHQAKLDQADAPEFDRKALAEMMQPYGPLVGLGVGDPARIRAILKKCGIDRIIVTPEGPGAWRFEGQADFSGVVHRRTPAAPPDGPHRFDAADCPGDRHRPRWYSCDPDRALVGTVRRRGDDLWR